MRLIKGFHDAAHRPGLDEGIDVDFSRCDHVQNDGIVFRQTAPGSNDFSIKGHQAAHHVFALAHSETNDNQFADKTQQRQANFLAGTGARAVKSSADFIAVRERVLELIRRGGAPVGEPDV